MPLPILDLTDEVSAVHQITSLINKGTFPNVYLFGDTPVLVKEVESKHTFQPLTSHQLLHLISRYTTPGINKGQNFIPQLPKKMVTDVALSQIDKDQWSDVPKIKGIVYTPVLRPDKTFQTTPGYDPETQLFYIPRFETTPVPATPTGDDVRGARTFICDVLFADFPWVSNSDKTNAIALLVSQILKPSFNFLVPLGWYSAPRAASGKTHLVAMHEQVFGGQRISWPNDDKELAKRIDSTLVSSAHPTVVFDNVDTGKRVDTAALAEILTSPVHTARVLGTSNAMDIPNSKIWLINGNNIKVGGDIASRICPVEISPEGLNPEDRKGFKINLNRWNDNLRSKVLYSIMVLVQDWINSGALEDKDVTLRGFEHWFQVLGGFCKHHEMYGLMENRKRVVSEIDDEAMWWEEFLGGIFDEYKDERWKPQQLRDKADTLSTSRVSEGVTNIRMVNTKLAEAFPKEDNDNLYSAVKLGKMMKAHVGMQYGPYKLNSSKDSRTHGNWYYISRS